MPARKDNPPKAANPRTASPNQTPRRLRILHPATTPPAIILRASVTTARKGRIAAATAAVIVDAADAADVSDGVVAAVAVAAVIGIAGLTGKAAGATCLLPSMLLRKVVIAKTAAALTAGVRMIVVRRRPTLLRKRARTTSFYRVNRSPSSERAPCHWLLLSRLAITNPKSGSPILIQRPLARS